MRVFGPGSISSLLKTILDVVYVGLLIAVGLVALVTLAALLLSFNPEVLAHMNLRAEGQPVSNPGPFLAGGLLMWALYLSGVLIIVGTLRRIFATLTAGDPFHPTNVKRLRLIGLMLAGLELIRYALRGLSYLAPGLMSVSKEHFSLTAWFSVLVVFVLAEVFREGARLRREAELTI